MNYYLSTTLGDTMDIQTVPIELLHFDPANVRKHNSKNIDGIKASLAKFKQQKPIVVDGDNVVIAGNGTLEAAKALGWKEIVVNKTHLTGPEAIAYAISDNRTAELAEWDKEGLGSHLQGLQEDGWVLEELGFDLDDLEEYTDQPDGGSVEGEDDVPEIPQNIHNVQRGQIYQLGNHRLMCGDSTAKEDVDRLMAGEKADMVFTDPPYNVASHSKNVGASVSKAMKDLKESEWDKDFQIEKPLELLKNYIENGAVYVWCNHFLFSRIMDTMKGWADFEGWNVWTKPNPMPSLMKRHWTWNSELCCYFTKGKHVFNFPTDGHALASWEFTKKSDGTHPTQKPVELCEYVIKHSSNANALVLDLFLGSGSTLIACEKTNRKCYGMEIDPHYCSVIIERYQQFTDKKAVLV